MSTEKDNALHRVRRALPGHLYLGPGRLEQFLLPTRYRPLAVRVGLTLYLERYEDGRIMEACLEGQDINGRPCRLVFSTAAEAAALADVFAALKAAKEEA